MKIKLYLLDGLLLNCIYLAIHVGLSGSIVLTSVYAKLLLLMNGSWFVIVLLDKKFFFTYLHSFSDVLLKFGRDTVLMLFITTIVLVLWDRRAFPKVYVLGTFITLFLIELVVAAIYRPHLWAVFEKNNKVGEKKSRTALSLLIADLELFVGLYFFVHYFKYGTMLLEPRHWQIFGILLGFWGLSAQWTGKFEIRQHRNFFYAYEPFIKAVFIMVSASALVFYILEILEFSRTMLFAPSLILILVEGPMLLIWMALNGYDPEHIEDMDVEDAGQVTHILREESQDGDLVEQHKVSAHDRLRGYLWAEQNQLFSLLDNRCDLEKLDLSQLSVLDTEEMFNIYIIEQQSLQMFVNLHRVNDVSRLNHYFLTVHQKLERGGIFAGVLDTVEARSKYLNAHYPKYLAKLLYLFDFMWRRVIPKLPGSNHIYFMITKGRNRIISKAELLGRLCFCGFRIVAAEENSSKLYYVAQKIKPMKITQHPSYGPLVSLKRIGYQGKIFHLFKLRTMYPYSEFIQDYVYSQNNLEKGGKFKNDFRVTSWGRIFRAFWLDELPQIYNYFHGDVKLVGVRALSEHYFSLYPEDMQLLRIQFKPGMVPPYYADLPQSFDEIIESERRYLLRKQEHPISTDWIYFFRAFNNIIFKHARSK